MYERSLTDDGQHARGFGCSGVTLVLSLIVEHGLVYDEDPLDALRDDLVLLSFPDLTAVLKPANLQQKSRVIISSIISY